MTHLPPPAALSEALLESRYFHHAVVLTELFPDTLLDHDEYDSFNPVHLNASA